MEVDEAYSLIEKAVQSGRVANAYLLVGGVRGCAGELAERVLHLLFGPGDLRVHPDVHRLVPAKKTRVIPVDAMRERMIDPMEKTSFTGGWKAGVVVAAECMRPESANAFLKTLEEPPPRTLFLLLSERPEKLLPTIISRCQRVDLPDARGQQLEEPYRTQMLDVLASDTLTGVTARAAAAAKLTAILEELKGAFRCRRGAGRRRGQGACLVQVPRIPRGLPFDAVELVPRHDGDPRRYAKGVHWQRR